MDDNEWLADRFVEHRAHLRAVAHRMLGSATDADDAVQVTWLRVSRAGAYGVENLSCTSIRSAQTRVPSLVLEDASQRHSGLNRRFGRCIRART